MTMVAAASNLDTVSPLGFFTNVSDRLLMSQFHLDTSRIQIYPTNRYTPAVHRLLQLAANVYEATSTNAYPSVFRPLFSRDADGLGTNLFISGFTNVASVNGPDDSQLSLPMDVAALAETNIPVIKLPVNVYGIPWIIGARKGLPNFNEFAMESAFQLARKLQVTRPSTNSPVSDYHYNQMFVLSLSNQLGVECWNSYTDNFTDPVAMYVTDNQRVTLTNDEGLSTNIPVPLISGFRQIPNSTSSNWPGYNPQGSSAAVLLTPASFQIPLNASVTVVSPSVYRFNVGGLPYLTTNLTLPFETGVKINDDLLPQPHWYLTISNNVRVIIMDTAVRPYRIIDYVQLSGPDSGRDLTGEVTADYDTVRNGQPGFNGYRDMWDTNIISHRFPYGVANQLDISRGFYGILMSAGAWVAGSTPEAEINGFRAFFHFGQLYFGLGMSQAYAKGLTSVVMQAPFSPVATVVQHVSWQANDPLVHYLASDLNWSGADFLNRTAVNLTNENLGRLNQRYMPWGGHQPLNPDTSDFNTLNAYNLALKDPLVWRSDDWDFPTNESCSGEWLGRVHRGTPWQTVYLKASDILQQFQVTGGVTNYNGTNVWVAWTGDTKIPDAIAMAPVQDWHLASLLAQVMNARPLQSRFPVNNPRTNAWLRLFLRMRALTNNLSDSRLASGAAPQFETLVIRRHWPPAKLIANAIESARASQPCGFFHDVGDILEVPELSDQSPFLNWNDSVQQQRGISDEAYEILPSQLLPRLRADSVGSGRSTLGHFIVRFTGYDEHTYVVEASSNLLNWTGVSTNFCQNGSFNFTNPAPANASSQFYRSRLLR